jgi:asparagine synthase (glutamine-hydrolysing)
MTAIAGLIRFDNAPIDRPTIERMTQLLTPYGRDAQHTRIEPQAAFLRTLLRITPEDSLDQQPLYHAESQTVVLFDGRLDNREELAKALDIHTEVLRQMADSEVALHACLRWDTEAVDKLLGDFALGCWQPRQKRLLLARDALGTRPLYWHQTSAYFAFATLPKALFAIPGVEKAICEKRMHDFLCLLPMMGPESFFKDIYRVEPGSLLVLDGQQRQTRRYHRWDPKRQLQLGSDDEYLEAFREQVERAVACRLRSAGPIASHLSSGFDSSTVTAIAARQLALKGQSLLAYTAVPREGFDGAEPKGRHNNEAPGAQALAARFPNIEHHLFRPGQVSAVDSLDQDVDTLGRPPLNLCNMVWLNGIEIAAVRRGAKVLLTGQMGNLTLSYTGEEYLPVLLRQGHWSTWWREASALKHRNPSHRWLGLLKKSISPYLPAPLWLLIERMKDRTWDLTEYSAVHPDFLKRMDHDQRIKDIGWDLSLSNRPWADGRKMRIAVLQYVDLGDHGLGSNAHGLESRDPTADRRLIEFCLSVPYHQYLRNGQTRWLLHRLMGETQPPEIVNARTKGLQAPDWYENLTQRLPETRQRLIEAKASGIDRTLDLDALIASLDEWPITGWEKRAMVSKYRLRLLRGLSATAFIQATRVGNQ